MDFILTETALSAAHIRRELAKEKTAGVRVGDMDALLQTLSELWLVPPVQQDWEARLQETAPKVEGAFWEQSLQTDEPRTVAKLSQALQFALNHLPLEGTLQPIKAPNERYERYFNDLVRLHKAMDAILPDARAFAAQWYQHKHEPAIEPLHLHLQLDCQALHPWQQDIVHAVWETTGRQAPGDTACQHPEIEAVLARSLEPNRNGKQSLHGFVEALFSPEHSPVPKEDIHWLTCRDALEETEAVTAMVQKASEQGTPPERMAIVVPETSDYVRYLESEMNKAGILLSNVSGTMRVWDWQSALLHDLLQHHLNPKIPMACMSVLINPLMPWSITRGHRFAENIQKGGDPESDDTEEQALLDHLLKVEVRDDPEDLMEWLKTIVQCCEARNQFALTQARMSELLEKLASLLRFYRDHRQTDYIHRALAQLPVGEIPVDTEAIRLLNAVTLIHENAPLPFQVSELFLLGFNQGNYQYREAATGAIPIEHWDTFVSKTQLQIPEMEQEQSHWKERFRELLSRAENRVTFTLAQYDFDGTTLESSESLVDMALCFIPPEDLEPEALLASAASFTHPLLDPEAITLNATPEPNLRDLTLGADLLQEKDRNRDKPLTESPSSLERLMLSPLVWVLDRFHLKSRQWEPLKADPAVQGSVAHYVFELHAKVQETEWSDDRFGSYFEKAVEEKAAFLNLPEWEFNRRQLRQQVRTALQGFIAWCQQTGWHLEQAELQLQGTLWDVPVSGWADALLQQNGNKLVLDYKKSKHDSYLQRLNKGYDLQTYIYRSLYSQSHGSESVISGYFAMNDCHLVSDHPLAEAPGIRTKQPTKPLHEQSQNAYDAIQKRLTDLRNGTVALNSANEAENWKKLGVKPYALTDSNEAPLLKRFTRPDMESPE